MTSSVGQRDDVAWIRDQLIPTLARDGQLLKHEIGKANRHNAISQREQQHVKSIDVRCLSMSESFMLSICYKIKVVLSSSGPADVVVADDSDDELLQLVVKITPDIDAETLRLVCFGDLFHNEIIAYEVIFPALGWSDAYPRCYYSHNRPAGGGAAIALSDFTADGWRLAHAKYNLSLAHICVAVAELGKLHGSMYGLKHTQRERFGALCAQLHESRFVSDGTAPEWERRLCIGAQRVVAAARRKRSGGDDGGAANEVVPEWFLDRLESVLRETFAYQKRIAQRQSEPLAILCHGDFLRNNIAFQYADETNEAPIRAMLFDFQTLRYASPALDLCTFVANSTGRSVRRPHFEHIFATYHAALVEHFRRVSGIGAAEAPAHLGAERLLREYALYMPYGLSIGGSFLPMLHVPDETPLGEYAARSADYDTADAWQRGGQAVDDELAALVAEMFALYERFGLELKEEF